MKLTGKSKALIATVTVCGYVPAQMGLVLNICRKKQINRKYAMQMAATFVFFHNGLLDLKSWIRVKQNFFNEKFKADSRYLLTLRS